MKINPVLKYYGSKYRLADWIISHFPKHRHYVEPFGGAANILLQKPASKLETYNDLNKSLVNFFRTLRDQPEELIQKIRLTPWARVEFARCLEHSEETESIEWARRLFFHLNMSYAGTFKSSPGNWRRHKSGRRNLTRDVKPENLFEASRRFLQVQIENRDAFQLIREMDSEDTLFYLDPPYLFSTRGHTAKSYSHEMTDDNHREFAELLYGLKGFVILSGYPSLIYEELFERKGWSRIDKETITLSGNTATECIWLSPSVSKALILS